MEKIKVFLSSPCLTLSGYGEHSRFIYRALKSREDLFDIYMEPVKWGNCRWLSNFDKEREEMEAIFYKTAHAKASTNGMIYYDVNIEVKIPTEWKQRSLTNIGVTSGIETIKALPNWNEAANKMDLIIVESEHAKQCFDTTCPIEVVSFPERSMKETKEFDLKLETDFNFLLVSQLISRKNIPETIYAFLEEFNNDADVGLVAKISTGLDSFREMEKLEGIIKKLIKTKFEDKKCKIYLVFGYLNAEEMNYIYTHENIKALVTMTKGEGFGLPIFEAACSGMPVIAPFFSGQKDFLSMPVKKNGKYKNECMAAKIDYSLGKVLPEDCWGTELGPIVGPEQIWAYPSKASCKFKMRSMKNNYGSFKKKAKILQNYLVENLTKEKQYALIVDAIYKAAKNNMV